MATVTITTTSAEDARIAAAFGAYLGMQQTATAAQVKQAVVAWIVKVVRDYEYQTELDAVQRPDPINPT